MNFYINRAQLWLAEANGDENKIQKTLDRIAATVASMLLGLYSNETIEQYYVRNPSHKEYMDWWQQKRKSFNY